jgi:hypothetical protein
MPTSFGVEPAGGLSGWNCQRLCIKRAPGFGGRCFQSGLNCDQARLASQGLLPVFAIAPELARPVANFDGFLATEALTGELHNKLLLTIFSCLIGYSG